MKKMFKYFIFILLLVPFSTKAAGSYSVEMVSGSSNNRVIGTYNTYNEALSVMNSQSSSNNSVATIFRNGVPVDSKYAIFKFKPSGNSTFPLYRNAGSSSSYTSINTSYVGEAAVLGYSDNGRVKIMVSGFTGYISADAGIVTPISLLSASMININGSGVRLRSDHSTSSSIVANISGSYNFNYTDTYKGSDYTWYKINYNGKTAWAAGGSWVSVYNSNMSSYYNHYGPTGNLIHHFTVYSGGKYTDSFTNLGTSPSYLTKDVYYYSFDGNYFYNDITSMLEDYRSGTYNRSVNKDNPHYSYYLYLTARSTSGYSASDLDAIVTSNGYNSSSKMYGTGSAFKEAEEVYGTNALLAFATALNESAWGTSSIARNKNNLFGYGASDSCPYDCAYSYNSPRDSIMDYASKSSTSYETVSGKYYYGSHYGNKSSGKNIMYATDPYWGEKMAAYAFTRDLKFGGKDFNSNTIGVTKKGVSNVNVYRDASTGSVLYTMKNSRTGDPVYDFTANIVDKVNNNGTEFYKIYTDLSKEQEKYGYVLASQFNVSNSQPVINANDVEIKVGDNYNYMNGVSAFDRENGDLTSKITYEGYVDPNKEGVYGVTYSVVDNSNFHASKKINVKVVNNDTPVIEAADKEILQFSEFNYLDGVSAHNNNGNLEVSYEGDVDTSKVGEYKVTYKTLNVSKTITIKVIENSKPVIEASDKTINLNDNFNYLDGVKATDKEDGELEVTYDGSVDASKTGEYKITYSASDKEGQIVSKEVTVTVTVVDAHSEEVKPAEDVTPSESTDISGEVEEATGDITKNLEEKNGLFYLDYLKNVDGKLQIKGYNTIEGINNNLNEDIHYELVLKDLFNKEYHYILNRVADKNDMTIVPNSIDGKDYSYSWFVGNIDVDSIPEGDYVLYLRSFNKKYYSINVVQNVLLNEQLSHFESKGKNITIFNDYTRDDIPVNFQVRNERIGLKETSSDTNQYSYLEDISFNNNKKLHIRGASYSVGLDLRIGSKLDRKIIFENISTYKKYSFDLGYIDKGTFDISLLSDDGFGKSKPLSWYEKELDVSSLEAGKYAIYISNVSNISDYSELNDILLYNDFSDISSNINQKKYKVILNEKLRDRVELEIK